MITKKFIRWELLATLQIVGLIILFWTGLPGLILAADPTFITFSIILIHMFVSGHIGYMTWKDEDYETNFHWQMSDIVLGLGMLGTLAGFLIMMYTGFAVLDVSNVESTRIAMLGMATGMGTALWTTAAGLVSSIFLRLQLVNYETDTE